MAWSAAPTFEGVGLVLLVGREVLQEVPEAALLEDAHQGGLQSLVRRRRHLAKVSDVGNMDGSVGAENGR